MKDVNECGNGEHASNGARPKKDLDAILRQSLENGRAFVREQSRQEIDAFEKRYGCEVTTSYEKECTVRINVGAKTFVGKAETWQRAWNLAKSVFYSVNRPSVIAPVVKMKHPPAPQTVWVNLEEAAKLINHLQHQIYLLARGCEKNPTLPLTCVGDPKIHVLIKELHKD